MGAAARRNEYRPWVTTWDRDDQPRKQLSPKREELEDKRSLEVSQEEDREGIFKERSKGYCSPSRKSSGGAQRRQLRWRRRNTRSKLDKKTMKSHKIITKVQRNKRKKREKKKNTSTLSHFLCAGVDHSPRVRF